MSSIVTESRAGGPMRVTDFLHRSSPRTSFRRVRRSHPELTRPPVRAYRLGQSHAELLHLREDINDSPRLDDAAVGESEDEDFVVDNGLGGRLQAHVFT